MYSVIDIEGNGAGFRQESIIEIAVYRFDGRKIVDQFISLINPEADITPFVQKLTGIKPAMVRSAPHFHEVAKRVVEITANSTLVGHNVDFDYRMLRQEFKRLGYDFKIPTLDTIPLAQKLLPEAESYSLGKLVKSLGIPLNDQHRAAGDARATVELFKLLMNKDENSEIIQKQHLEANAKTYVNKVRDLTQDLPSKAGILYFQNEKGKIIRTAFAENINKFAKDAFRSAQKKWQEIQEQTGQITYELTGNEVLAKLLMHTKKIRKSKSLPFGLFFRSGKWLTEKIVAQKEIPLLKFSSFTQGKKAIAYLDEQVGIHTPEELQSKIGLKRGKELWLSSGRSLGEKSFLIVENGYILSYGFYEIHTQINSLKKLNAVKINVENLQDSMENDLKLSLLKGDFDIQPLPH